MYWMIWLVLMIAIPSLACIAVWRDLQAPAVPAPALDEGERTFAADEGHDA